MITVDKNLFRYAGLCAEFYTAFVKDYGLTAPISTLIADAKSMIGNPTHPSAIRTAFPNDAEINATITLLQSLEADPIAVKLFGSYTSLGFPFSGTLYPTRALATAAAKSAAHAAALATIPDPIAFFNVVTVVHRGGTFVVKPIRALSDGSVDTVFRIFDPLSSEPTDVIGPVEAESTMQRLSTAYAATWPAEAPTKERVTCGTWTGDIPTTSPTVDPMPLTAHIPYVAPVV